MPTREEIMAYVRQLLAQKVKIPDDFWIGIYCLLLDYIHDVPRITDSNRLKKGVWVQRAKQVEDAIAVALHCPAKDVQNHVSVLMQNLYEPGTQGMNPVGIAFACGVVDLIERFCSGKYQWMLEAKIQIDVFPNLTNFRRSNVDIVAFKNKAPFAVISSKWGIRHDRVRDPQEEADTYKKEVPSLKFYVVTNEFDNGRLQQILTYPTIDGVFHVRRDLVWKAYGNDVHQLAKLKDITELIPLFP